MKEKENIKWIDSYLACKACGNHLMCDYHAKWVLRELKATLKKQPCKQDSCDAC